jgi:Protein of unknown function (DUF3105)
VAKKRKRKRTGRARTEPPRPNTATRTASPSRTNTEAAAGANSDRRRSLIVRGVVLVVVSALVYLLFIRARGPGEVAAEATNAAEAAGCDELEQPVEADPARTHLAPGEAFDYADRPAAAGPHDGSPLPPDPHVYEEPIPETRAVHNLEHAYVLVYYRPTDEGGPSAETVEALEALARDQDRVIMAPYPGLPDERGFALLAWNTRWMCPSTVTGDQAVTIATGFVDAFAGTTVAPEAPRGLLGPVLQR